MANDAEQVAGALQALGVGPGDVVAVQLPGSYEGAVIQVAVGLCGAVLLPVVMIYGPREMDFVLRRSGAVAVVLPREHRGRPHAAVVLSGMSRLPALKSAVVVGDDTPGDGAVGYAELFHRPGGRYREPAPDPGDRAVLMYTSGTTAEPKGVQHSHRSLLAEATSGVYTRVCAVVVPRPGFTFDVDQARAHFADAGAARQKAPEVIVLVDELPRTPSGKVRKHVLRAVRAGSRPPADHQ